MWNNIYAKEFDLIQFVRIMRIHTREVLCRVKQVPVKTKYWKSKPDAQHMRLNRAFIYPIIGFLIRSHCMNYTLYRRADRKSLFM